MNATEREHEAFREVGIVFEDKDDIRAYSHADLTEWYLDPREVILALLEVEAEEALEFQRAMKMNALTVKGKRVG